MRVFFDAKILELIPSLVHKGDVIEQEILAGLRSGKKRKFADESALVKPGMKGKWVRLSVYVAMKVPQKNARKEYSVGPGYSIKGKIMKLKIEGNKKKKVLKGVLDCGAAKFSFACDYSPGLMAGDFVAYDSDIGYPAGIESVKEIKSSKSAQ